jgi:hypothetical protein
VKRPSNICHCGHEKAEHFDHPEGRANCMRQCDCQAFLSEDAPKPLPPRPDHIWNCECSRCKLHPQPTYPDWEEDPPPSTDPMPPMWP